jgi:Tol biopolymer transport system component
MRRAFKTLLMILLFATVSCATCNQATETPLLVISDTPSASQTPTATNAPSAQPADANRAESIPSPDGLWLAHLDKAAGSLALEDPRRLTWSVFPAGSTVNGAKWSSEGQRLIVVLSNWPESRNNPEFNGVPEIWQISISGNQAEEPALLYRAPQQAPDKIAPTQIILGSFSPDGHHLLFWAGPLSASILSDGMQLWSLNIETAKATRLTEAALLNSHYQSWSPDSRELAFTDGGYRSAQVGKWLSLYYVASDKVRTLISQDAQVPGAVAWSPRGDLIAYAAIEAGQTDEEWADWMGWDNPAILARRIYLLDPLVGTSRRLNEEAAYQDAPTWSRDGTRLYFVQMEKDGVVLMSADPATGEASAVKGCLQSLPETAGYYGQVDWSVLLECEVNSRP